MTIENKLEVSNTTDGNWKIFGRLAAAPEGDARPRNRIFEWDLPHPMLRNVVRLHAAMDEKGKKLEKATVVVCLSGEEVFRRIPNALTAGAMKIELQGPPRVHHFEIEITATKMVSDADEG